MAKKTTKKIDVNAAKVEELELEARRVRLRAGVRAGSKSLGRALGGIGRAVSA